jgi:hypothetical protein
MKDNAYEVSGDTYVSFGSGLAGFQPRSPFAIRLRLHLPEDVSGSLLNRFVNNGTVEPGWDLYMKNGRLKFRLCSQYILKKGYCLATEDPLPENEWVDVAVSSDGSGSAFGVSMWVNGVPVNTVVEFDHPEGAVSAGAELRLGRRVGGSGVIGTKFERFQVFDRALKADELGGIASDSFMTLKVAQTAARKALFDFRKKHGTPVMVMQEAQRPNKSYRFVRGNYATPDRGQVLQAAIPDALGSLKNAGNPDRLGLARWLVGAENPLTARVYVNRLWQQHFGVGLVETAADFGFQGSFPSHRYLLDWLAVEFMESGWDIQHMHKLMVLSATYGQSSKATAEKLERDSANRFLSRGPRFRLDAAALRDQALAASGLLVRDVGGPSVRPYQTPGLWREISGKTYAPGRGAQLYRRGLYTYWKRTIAPPRMSTFDSALRETCTVRTPRTNTPMQALTLLNDPTYVEAARVLAGNMAASHAELRERIQHGARRVLGRNLDAAAVSRLADGYAQHLETFQANPDQAKALLSVGARPTPQGVDVAEQAALTSIAMVLFNLDTTVTQE